MLDFILSKMYYVCQANSTKRYLVSQLTYEHELSSDIAEQRII